MTQGYAWQRYYEVAILETDRSRLPNLIKDAQSAIDARLAELESNHALSDEERLALEDAMAGLNILRNERG